MDALHQYNYSLEDAMCSLIPNSGPVLCRDEMEEWSASEANLFEEALDKYGKDFNDIRQDFVSTYRIYCFFFKKKIKMTNSIFLNIILASMENIKKYNRILLYVENYRSICPTKTSESC